MSQIVVFVIGAAVGAVVASLVAGVANWIRAQKDKL